MFDTKLKIVDVFIYDAPTTHTMLSDFRHLFSFFRSPVDKPTA